MGQIRGDFRELGVTLGKLRRGRWFEMALKFCAFSQVWAGLFGEACFHIAGGFPERYRFFIK